METFQLGRRALQQIHALIKREAMIASRRLRSEQLPQVHAQGLYIGKAGSSGIPARSGTTPGKGLCAVYRVNSSDELEAAKNNAGDSVVVDAYNLSSGAVAANAWVQLKQEMASGKFFCDFEDCPEE